MSIYYLAPTSELYHHGVKGMKWGVRRYQNPDGSLTQEGRKRARRIAQKTYDKIETGSIHRVTSYAFKNQGLKRLSDFELRSAEKQERRWKDKLNKLLSDLGDLKISDLQDSAYEAQKRRDIENAVDAYINELNRRNS